MQVKKSCWLVRSLFGFYGISTFGGYLMPNPFLYKQLVLFQTLQFSMSTQFNYQKHFYCMPFSLVKQFYFKQFSFVQVRNLVLFDPYQVLPFIGYLMPNPYLQKNIIMIIIITERGRGIRANLLS